MISHQPPGWSAGPPPQTTRSRTRVTAHSPIGSSTAETNPVRVLPLHGQVETRLTQIPLRDEGGEGVAPGFDRWPVRGVDRRVDRVERRREPPAGQVGPGRRSSHPVIAFTQLGAYGRATALG